jgi:hypothetical protein
MNEKLNLKELEKKAYKSTFQDGLWDIYFSLLIFTGALISVGGLIPLPESFNYFLILIPYWIVDILILFFGKRYITVPRLGFVKFGERRKRNVKYLLIFTLFNVLLLIMILILPITGLYAIIELEKYISALLFGLGLIWFPLTIVAFILKFNRFYLYAIMGGLSFFGIEIVFPLVGEPLDSIIIFGLIGGIILIIGFSYLIKFLIKYPLPKTEEIEYESRE